MPHTIGLAVVGCGHMARVHSRNGRLLVEVSRGRAIMQIVLGLMSSSTQSVTSRAVAFA